MNDTTSQTKEPKSSILKTRAFMYFFMISLIIYSLLSGYFLIFSGSVFFEGVVKGWYRPGADVRDNYALWWSFLTSFPCLLGVFGGLAVLSSRREKYFKIKVLLFVPSVVWTAELVLGNFRWGFQYWEQWLFLVPLMLLSMFVLFCVWKKVNIPIFAPKPEQTITDGS